MSSSELTLEEYRKLSDEERELLRLQAAEEHLKSDLEKLNAELKSSEDKTAPDAAYRVLHK